MWWFFGTLAALFLISAAIGHHRRRRLLCAWAQRPKQSNADFARNCGFAPGSFQETIAITMRGTLAADVGVPVETIHAGDRLADGLSALFDDMTVLQLNFTVERAAGIKLAGRPDTEARRLAGAARAEVQVKHYAQAFATLAIPATRVSPGTE